MLSISRITCPVNVCFIVSFFALCVQADAQDAPTASGIIRLTRGWHVTEVSPDSRLAATSPLPAAIDLDRPPKTAPRKDLAGPLVLMRTFRVPSSWQSKQVWLTYDARRMACVEPHGFLLNGRPLALRIPSVATERTKGKAATTSRADGTWFVDISSLLTFDKDNKLEFCTRAGIPDVNAGFWLYSMPTTEKILLLASMDLTRREMELLRQYSSAVEKTFGIEAIVESRSFENASVLRDYLKATCARQRISGVVLVGSHPTPRFDFGHCPGLNPRFYEDFDAVWNDRNADGVFDDVNIDAGYGSEIWTSWVRKIPDQPGLLAAFLEKSLRYFRGELIFPGNRAELPRVVTSDAGIDHVDLFMRPGDFAGFGTHAGVIHNKGPCKRVPPEVAMEFYPGSVVVMISGCQSGNISKPVIKPPEAYVFGRSNALVSFAGARSGGGGPEVAFSLPGIQEELARIVPHMGIYYQYMIDMSKVAPMTYVDSAMFMFGNPFVNFDLVKPARGATVTGTVIADGNSTVYMDTFYVSADRDGKCFGRVRVDQGGKYRIECLPPGKYDIQLHLNPIESLKQTLTVAAGETKDVRWSLPRLWMVHGTITDAMKRAEKDGWVEVASRNAPALFDEGQIYGVRTNERGEFVLQGQKPGVVWIRARSGQDWESPPQSISVKNGAKPIEVAAQLAPGERAERRSEKAAELAALVESPNRVFFEHPLSEDEYPEVDVVEVFMGLVPAGSKTVPAQLRTAKGRFAADGRAEHQLRLGLRLADGLDIEGPEKVQRYEWQITGLGEPMTVSVHYREAHTRWEATLRSGDADASPFLKVVPVNVSGDWVFVDLIPKAESQKMEFSLFARTIRGRGRDRFRDQVPNSRATYRVTADVSPSPSLTAKEVIGRSSKAEQHAPANVGEDGG